MALNEIYRDGDHIALPVAEGTKSGDPVAVGSLVGVAQTDRDAAGNATVWLTGVFDVPVSDAVASVGLAVYITSAGVLTNAASGNTIVGYALATKGATAGYIPVKIARV